MKKYHQGLAFIEAEFEVARIRMNNPNADDLLSTYNDAGMKDIVYEWYIETTDRLDDLDKKNKTLTMMRI